MQEAPSDPAEPMGRNLEEAEIDGASGELRLRLSGNRMLTVIPAQREASDDPPNWALITLDGIRA